MKKLRPSGGLTAFLNARPVLRGFVSVSSAVNADIVPGLCQKLLNPAVTLTMTERGLIAELLNEALKGKLKPAPRSRAKTYLRHCAIVDRVHELTLNFGKQDAAIAAVMKELGCSRRTVMTALKKCK